MEHEDNMAIARIKELIVHIPEDLYWSSIYLNFLIAPELDKNLKNQETLPDL